MRLLVLSPPSTEDNIKKVALEILLAAESFGKSWSYESFIHAWIKGTRVIVDKNHDGKITSMALLVTGESLIDPGFISATVTYLHCSEKETIKPMLNYLKDASRIMGASKMFYKDPFQGNKEPNEDGETPYIVIEAGL